MTREEISTMTAESIEDVNFTIDIILKQVKPDFVKTAIRAELNEVESNIKENVKNGVMLYCNGYLKVNWSYDEQEKCYEANRLIYIRNRLEHLLYHA